MKPRRNTPVLVTDADHGVGRAAAICLGEAGFQVLAGGEDLSRMSDLPRETAPGGLIEITSLTTADEASCAAALERVREVFGHLHGIVWAGGAARFGPLEELGESETRALMEANVHAPWRLLRLGAPILREQGHGVMVCVSSAAGRFALPLSSAYSASRYALEGLCDALRLELSFFGVHVVLIEPGLLRERVTTASPEALTSEDLFGVADDSPYARISASMTDAYHQLIGRAATPEDVARVIETALTVEEPRPRYAVSRRTAALLWARKLLPDRLVDHRLVQRLRGD